MAPPPTSRGLFSSIAGAILAGLGSAGLLAFALSHAETIFVFVLYMTALPLFIVGLGAGGLASLLASVAGALGLFFNGPSNFAFIYAFIFAVPAMVLTILALRYRLSSNGVAAWFPTGSLLTVLTFYPCIIFMALASLAWNYHGGLLALTSAKLNEVAPRLIAQVPQADPATVQILIDRAAQIAPALTSIIWVFVFMACMATAQLILQSQKWNLRDTFAFKSLQVPGWLVYAVAGTGLVGAFAPAQFDYIGANISLILGLSFLFVGLAVMHSWAATTRMPYVVLILLYALVLFLPWLILLVALVGVLDQWANFRSRLAMPKILP